MEKKIQIVEKLVEMGYELYDQSIEEYAAASTKKQLLATLEELSVYLENFQGIYS